MAHYLTFTGLISYFAFTGFSSIVEIHRDITVKPTPDQLLSITESVNVTMNCTGSRYDIRYYITNKMRWTFIANSGKELLLTDSFFLTEDAANSSDYPNARLSLLYHRDIKGFKFGITIRRVKRGDTGIYRCSLVDEDNHVTDSKDVKLTVVNPIESMRIEMFDASRDFIFASDSPVSQNSQPLKIAPGQYMVKCKAHGSNPEPVMDLFLNNQNVRVSVKSKEDKSSDFKSFNGNFMANSLPINSQYTLQTLVCKANIPGDFYQSSEVGIALMVQITKPTFVCEDTSRAVCYRKLKCNVSVGSNKYDLVCDNISWLLSKRGKLIKYDERWKDQSKEYDILESNCVKTNLGLNAMLDIYKVNGNSLQEKFFIVYGKGENVHTHAIELHDNTSAKANAVTLFPVLYYLALAGISKQLHV